MSGLGQTRAFHFFAPFLKGMSVCCVDWTGPAGNTRF